jgi:hypothetical protein
MSELWYYAEGGEPRGPLSLADLIGNLSKASDLCGGKALRIGNQ